MTPVSSLSSVSHSSVSRSSASPSPVSQSSSSHKKKAPPDTDPEKQENKEETVKNKAEDQAEDEAREAVKKKAEEQAEDVSEKAAKERAYEQADQQAKELAEEKAAKEAAAEEKAAKEAATEKEGSKKKAVSEKPAPGINPVWPVILLLILLAIPPLLHFPGTWTVPSPRWTGTRTPASWTTPPPTGRWHSTRTPTASGLPRTPAGWSPSPSSAVTIADTVMPSRHKMMLTRDKVHVWPDSHPKGGGGQIHISSMMNNANHKHPGMMAQNKNTEDNSQDDSHDDHHRASLFMDINHSRYISSHHSSKPNKYDDSARVSLKPGTYASDGNNLYMLEDVGNKGNMMNMLTALPTWQQKFDQTWSPDTAYVRQLACDSHPQTNWSPTYWSNMMTSNMMNGNMMTNRNMMTSQQDNMMIGNMMTNTGGNMMNTNSGYFANEGYSCYEDYSP